MHISLFRLQKSQDDKWCCWDQSMSHIRHENGLNWRAWQDGSNYYNLTTALSCEWEVISQSLFLETVAYVLLSCPFICIIIMFLCVDSPSSTAACWWFPKIAVVMATVWNASEVTFGRSLEGEELIYWTGYDEGALWAAALLTFLHPF
jgi:hypothetical protein